MKKQMMNEIKNQVTEMAVKQTVAQLRKLAQENGIKNASKFKRVDLEPMVVAAIVNAKLEAVRAEAKATKKAVKKSNEDKRFKADKVIDEQVEALAQVIVAEKMEQVELFQQNRKVLIVVMKMLHCKKWYRTYDKATMVSKITEAFATA